MPVTTASGETVSVVVDGYKLANTAVLRLATGPVYSSVLPQMIHEIAAGDGAGIASSVVQYLPPAGLVGLGLQWSVFCGRISLGRVWTRSSHSAPRRCPGSPRAC